jgi:hypothetical protein
MTPDQMHAAFLEALTDHSRRTASKTGQMMPLRPFRAVMPLDVDDEMEVDVVGVHLNGEGEYSFVYVAHDDSGEIYVEHANALKGTLPYCGP